MKHRCDITGTYCRGFVASGSYCAPKQWIPKKNFDKTLKSNLDKLIRSDSTLKMGMVQFDCGSGNTVRSRPKIRPTRSASEGSGCPRLRVGLVSRRCYPLLNQVEFGDVSRF